MSLLRASFSRASTLYDLLASLAVDVRCSIAAQTDAVDPDGRRAEYIKQMKNVLDEQIIPALKELFELCGNNKDLNSNEHNKLNRQLTVARSADAATMVYSIGLLALGDIAYQDARCKLCVSKSKVISEGLWKGLEYKPNCLVPFADAWASFYGHS